MSWKERIATAHYLCQICDIGSPGNSRNRNSYQFLGGVWDRNCEMIREPLDLARRTRGVNTGHFTIAGEAYAF